MTPEAAVTAEVVVVAAVVERFRFNLLRLTRSELELLDKLRPFVDVVPILLFKPLDSTAAVVSDRLFPFLTFTREADKCPPPSSTGVPCATGSPQDFLNFVALTSANPSSVHALSIVPNEKSTRSRCALG